MLLGGVLLSVWAGTRRRVYTSLSALVVAGIAVAVIGLTRRLPSAWPWPPCPSLA